MKRKHRIKRSILYFVLSFIIIFSNPSTTVYANSIAVPMPSDVTTWEQFLQFVATTLGVEVSALTPALIQPYLVGALAVGACGYLGYDIYTNYEEIGDNVVTWLTGNSAYADSWFETYGEQILNGEVDLSQGITVPVSMFNDMVLAMSNTLTVDNSVAMQDVFTSVESTYINGASMSTWFQSLGYTGTWTQTTHTIYQPIVCMYNVALQDYYWFEALGYYSNELKDLLFVDVGGTVYTQIQYEQVVNDIGYALQPLANSKVGWSSWRLGHSGTQGIAPFFSGFAISDGGITCSFNDTIYNISVLTPSDSNVVVSNVSASELAFPLSYFLTQYSMIQLLPLYHAVTGLSITDVQTNAIAVDSTIDADLTDDVPIVIFPDLAIITDWVNGLVDEVAIDTAVSDEKPEDKKSLPYLWTGSHVVDLDIPQYIKDALLFVKECFGRIWNNYGDYIAVVLVPISLAVISIVIGRGFSKSKGGK